MKTTAGLLLCAFLAACASSPFSVGRDIPTQSVAKIVKGKTTAAELVQLLGEPYQKEVPSDTEEKWFYLYHAGEVTVEMGSAKTSGVKKTLDVLLRAGVVTNLVYSEVPMDQPAR